MYRLGVSGPQKCLFRVTSTKRNLGPSTRDLQTIYVPTISNIDIADKDTLTSLEGKVVEAAQRLRIQPLSMSLTMIAFQVGWAFVPNKQDPSRISPSSSLDSPSPSSPTSDLGTLIYGKDSKRTPESYKFQRSSRVDACVGEGGEWVEEQITGGTNFSILNSIENTEHSASVRPNQPHGFRISGKTLRSGHNKEVVIEDERVSAFLRYFLQEDENAMIVFPLLPNSRWSDYLDYSVPLHSKRYRALYPNAGTILDPAPRTPPLSPQNQSPPLSMSQTFQELLPKSPIPRNDLGSPFSLSTFKVSLSTPTVAARSQNGSDKGITVPFPSSYYMVFELHKLHELHDLNAKLELKHWLSPQVMNKQLITKRRRRE
ncbi:hypothetical protein F5876DRAFT_73911 [Lentinula aff. lateritia]|uniref:Uncharacterized protein n=1 Tax=Lentinula aff. lateritia TaxID=2804960 RepID=A0ACC1U9G7_9AGAR|nr:hypothetical protein F5876DRAFT_73911 [Lentinula aff. lateritia]